MRIIINECFWGCVVVFGGTVGNAVAIGVDVGTSDAGVEDFTVLL